MSNLIRAVPDGGRSRRGGRGAWWAVALGLAAACGAPPAPPAPPPLEPGLAVETFDAAWRIVYETYFDTTFNGVDWRTLGDTLRPRAAAAQDREELRDLIRGMLQTLRQSHFGLIPKEVADDDEVGGGGPAHNVGDAGFDFRLVGDRVVVTSVHPDGPAAATGVTAGWVVDAVEGEPVADLIRAVRETESRYSVAARAYGRVANRLEGPPGTARTVRFLDARDATREVVIALDSSAGQPVKFGNLPTFLTRFSSRRIERPDADLAVGLFWFNAWMVPLTRQVDRAVDDFRELDGIVVDLRGNGGGVGAMIMGVAGHFLDDRVNLGTMRTRTATLRMRANPRRVDTQGRPVRPYAGPVAVLVDELSASASEAFAGGLQSLGRVRVFGTTSLGAVLPASPDRLPNGDVLYHAFGEFVTGDSLRLEGRGVIPDEATSPTREALLAGGDPALDAAVAWIAAVREAPTGTVDEP